MNYILKDWYISFVKEKEGKRKYVAQGHVFHNPNFTNGEEIHTSYVESIRLQENCLYVQTMNSVYELPLNCCDVSKKAYSFWEEDYLWSEKPEESVVNRIREEIVVKAKEEKQRQEQERELLVEEEKECFVMLFDEEEEYYLKDAFVKGITPNGAEYTKHFSYHVHIGMFQDSVLLEPWEEGFDYRFFPYFGNRIEFYSWGDYEGNVLFINQGEHELETDTPCGKFILPADGKPYRINHDATAQRIDEPVVSAVDRHDVWGKNQLTMDDVYEVFEKQRELEKQWEGKMSEK